MYCFGCLMCGCWWWWPPIYCYFDFSQIFYIHNLSFSRSLSPWVCFYCSVYLQLLSCLLFCIVCLLQFSHFQLWHLNIQVQLLLYFFFFWNIKCRWFFPSLSRPNISKSLYLLYAIWLPVRSLYRFISTLVLLSLFGPLLTSMLFNKSASRGYFFSLMFKFDFYVMELFISSVHIKISHISYTLWL